MTPFDRIIKILKYKDVDRIPSALIFGLFKAKIGNVSLYDYINRVPATSRCTVNAIKNYPDNDMYTHFDGLRFFMPFPDFHSLWYFNWEVPDKNKDIVPKQLSAHLRDETIYDVILKKGITGIVQKNHPGSFKIFKLMLFGNFYTARTGNLARKNDLFPYGSGIFRHPADFLIGLRGIQGFNNDLDQNFIKVKKALEYITNKIILPNGYRLFRYAESEIRSCLILCSAALLSVDEKYFSEIVYNPIRDFVNKFTKAELYPIIHIDGNWDKTIPFFKELKELKNIIHIDHNSNIEKWADELAAHSVIMGNISPDLFNGNNNQELINVIRHISDIAKQYHNIIISNGCELPFSSDINAVNVFFKHVKEYGRLIM